MMKRAVGLVLMAALVAACAPRVPTGRQVPPASFPGGISQGQELPAGQGPRVTPVNNSVADDIQAKVEKNWVLPLGTPASHLAGLSIVVFISAMPDGTVANVKVLKGSGDAPLDNSLLRAVKKSVPLPVPQAAGHDAWEVKLVFRPKVK